MNLITLCRTCLLWLTITPHRSMIKPTHSPRINLHLHTYLHTFTVIKWMILQSEGAEWEVFVFLTPLVIVIRIHFSLQSVQGRQWHPFPPTITPWLIGKAVCAQFYWPIGISIPAQDHRSERKTSTSTCLSLHDEIASNILIDFEVKLNHQ